MTDSQAPLLIAYDGSDDARDAIASAGRLFGPRAVLVLTVWQDANAVPSVAWGALAAVSDLTRFADAARARAEEGAREGARLAEQAGFTATPLTVEADGPAWAAIVQVAKDRDTAAVVMGTRGRSGVTSALLGSVSTGVIHHADRPTMVIPRDDT